MGHKSFLNETSLNIRETEGLSGVGELNLRVGSRDRRSQRSSGTNYRCFLMKTDSGYHKRTDIKYGHGELLSYQSRQRPIKATNLTFSIENPQSKSTELQSTLMYRQAGRHLLFTKR